MPVVNLPLPADDEELKTVGECFEDIVIDQNMLDLLRPLLTMIHANPYRKRMFECYAMVEQDIPQESFTLQDKLIVSKIGFFENLVGAWVDMGVADLSRQPLEGEQAGVIIWTLLGFALGDMLGEADKVIQMWTSDGNVIVNQKTGEITQLDVDPNEPVKEGQEVTDITRVAKARPGSRSIN